MTGIDFEWLATCVGIQLQSDVQGLQKELGRVTNRWKLDVLQERNERIAAQRGLVPYVRSLEAFDHWLMERPDLRHALRPILQELGLWKISLGYDPDRDVAISVVSPLRMDPKRA